MSIPKGGMANGGLNKIVEEGSELMVVIAKQVAFPHQDNHPDGTPSLIVRMEEEIADLLAALAFVQEKWDMNGRFIASRMAKKLALYREWDKEQR